MRGFLRARLARTRIASWRLRALRSDLIDPTIAVHNGRVVKRTGDGALVEFRSVVDAVRCAIEVQNAMVERNVGMPTDRVCVHLPTGQLRNGSKRTKVASRYPR